LKHQYINIDITQASAFTANLVLFGNVHSG